MAQEFWSDKPLTITISGKSPNNSGIPKIDITGEKGIICGPSITSTTTSLNSSVSNKAAGSSANSVSTKFYASCQWDNPRIVTTNVNTYGNEPGCGKSTGNIKVKVWWDSVKKGDSSDDTYVEQTISNVTIKNAVETIDITGLSYSNGNPIPFKNGAYALNGYNEFDGIYVNYRLKGEYHKSTATSSTNLTYMPIYDSTVRVNINNTYSDSYTCVTPGTTEQYIINGKYFIPTKFNKSTSPASTTGSTDGGVVGPGDTVATPFPSGTFQIILQALGGYRQPSTAVTLDVAGFEPELVIESFTFSDSTQNTSGTPTIVFGNGINPAYVNVSYSGDMNIEVDSDTGQIASDTLAELFEDSVDRYKIGEVTATCAFGTQIVEQTVDVYMAASIVSYIKFTTIDNGTDSVSISLPTLDTSVPTIYYSTTGKNFQQMSISYNNSQWLEFSKERPIYIYGINPEGFSKSDTTYVHFKFNGTSKFNISGNIMGLIDGFNEVTTIPSFYCFYRLFLGVGLIYDASALRLPAKVIKGGAYYEMFSNCNNMVAGPDIDGTDNSGLVGTRGMFKGCTSLVECPKFSFEKVGDGACQEMFKDCYELINPPKILPATTLANSCYQSMFYSCHKLRFAPELPAKTLVNGCYSMMFADCKELRYVKALFTTNITNNIGYTENWMLGVNTSTGVFVKAVDATWSLSGESGIPTNWDYAYNYSNNEMEIVNTLYEYNNGQFSCDSLVYDSESLVEPNTIILYRNINGTLPKNSFTNAIKTIVISPYIRAINEQAFVPKTIIGDKAMHLTLVDMRDAGKNTGDGLNILGNRAFAGNNVLKRVFLPHSINTVANDIFYRCSQLAEIWYDGTIEEYNKNIGTTSFGALINPKCKIICTDGDIVVSSEPYYQGDYLTLSALEDGEITITISSDLGPSFATYLSYSKDKSVWERTDIDGREHTITIPVSRGDNVYLKGKAKQWYDSSGPGGASINSSANINVSGNIMSLLYEDNFEDKTVFPDNSNQAFNLLFYNNKHLCSAEKLILPATTLAVGCYRFMFSYCSSLTTAPALPATKLVDMCYWGMFNGCTSLNSITMLATDISAWACLDDWVSGVAATGTFTKAASMTSLPSGAFGIPTGWTVKNV